VVTVPKVKPLAPFALETGFTSALDTEMKLADHDAAGVACEPSVLSLTQLRAVPGSPDKLVLNSKLTSHAGPPGCSNVFVELLDENGARAGATLISNPTPDTTKNGEVSLQLPGNSRKVQLRLGPQSKPYAAFDVDLAGQSVTKR